MPAVLPAWGCVHWAALLPMCRARFLSCASGLAWHGTANIEYCTASGPSLISSGAVAEGAAPQVNVAFVNEVILEHHFTKCPYVVFVALIFVGGFTKTLA